MSAASVGAAQARRALTRTVTGVAVIASTLLLAIWVTGTASDFPMGRSHEHSATSPYFNHPHHHVKQKPQGPKEQPPSYSPRAVLLTGIVLGALALALIVGLVIVLRIRKEKRARARAIEALAAEDPAISALSLSRRDLDDARRRLADLEGALHGDPRNAIVACWIHLEQACATAGMARAPAETPTEFTVRVLTSIAEVDAVERLAALYLEARFSTHQLGEPQRVSAVDALTRVLRGLESSEPVVAR